MKKFYPVFFALLLVNSLSFAALKTWNGGTVGNKNWTTNGNWIPATAPVAGDDIVFNTAGTITFTTMPASVSYNSLTVSQGTVILSHTTGGGARTLTLGGIAGTDFTITLGASLTLSTNVNITMAANATGTINGTLTVNANSTFNSATNNGVVTTVNGTIINSGTVSGTTARLNFAAASTYQHAQNGGTIPIANWNLTSLCNITGVVGTAPNNLDANTFGDVTWNCPSQTWNGPGSFYNNVFNILGNLTVINTNIAGGGMFRFGGASPQVNYIGKDFSITGGEVKISGGTGRSVTVDGHFSISGSSRLLMDDNNTNAVFNIKGNFTQSGSSQIYEIGAATQSVINFAGPSPVAGYSATQTYSNSSSVKNRNQVNYVILNGATVDFGTNVVDGIADVGNTQGTFNVNSGGTIITAHTAGLNANGTNTGTIQLTGTRTYSSLANYTFNGTAVQNSGNFNTTPTANSVYRLTISNTAGNGTTGVTLSLPRSVSNSLIFTNGVLTTTATNILTLNAAATVTGTGSTISGGTTDRYVNGPMKRVGNNTNNYSFTFPVGAVSGGVSYYNPIAVSSMNGLAADTLLAQYFHTSGGNNSSVNPNGHTTPAVNFASYVEYWNLTMTTASKNANLTNTKVSLYFPHYNFGYSAIFDKGSDILRVMQFTASQWKDYYNTAAASVPVSSNSDINNFITSGDVVTSFGFFTFGTTSQSNAPLPLRFKLFTATKQSGYNNLHWEIGCLGKQLTFELQRSPDNRNYQMIHQLTADNLRCNAPFDYKDFTASGNKIYYRIKITDEYGNISYTPVALILNQGRGLEIVGLFPNPAMDNIILNVTTSAREKLQLFICDMSGKRVAGLTRDINAGSNLISIDTRSLSKGAYILSGLYSDGKIVSQQFIKQ